MLFLPRSFKLSSWSCRNSTWIETRCRALQKAGLVTGFSCVNIQFPGELGGLEWRRVGGRLTLSREDLWECKEQLKYLNSTPKIRNVECDLTLGITDLELIIKLQISKDLHKCVIHCSRSRAELFWTLNIWKEFVGHLSWIRWWAAHRRNAKELVKKKCQNKLRVCGRLHFPKMATWVSPHMLLLHGDLTLLSWRDGVSVSLLDSG